MRIALAQINYHIGHFEYNFNNICRAIEEAKNQHADLVVFGELSICGYPPRDFLEFSDFVKQCEYWIEQILPFSQDIGVLVGGPSVNPRVEGKDLFNSAWLLYQGNVVFKAHKALLPTYDIFDEYRYFEPAVEFSTVEFKGRRLAVTICEDLWNIGNENPLYTICPMDELMPQNPEVIINLSASPFSYEQATERKRLMRKNARRYQLPLFYANHIGAQTEIIFDGGSLAVSPDGDIYEELPYFERAVQTFDLDKVIAGHGNRERFEEKTPLIYKALITGIREYFSKLGFKSAILGLSGGIDSAVVATLACDALGPENVYGMLLPSEISSDHSVADAKALAENLGMHHSVMSIQAVNQAMLDTLEPKFADTEFGIAEENIQSRCRGVLLMALSNKFGHILLNTSNKSEMAVGYSTLYGDMCGGISVLGDVYKTEVYELAQYLNRDVVRIPLNSIKKEPSAELRPDQKDSDSLPDYAVLDELLYQYIEQQKGPKEIIEQGFDADLVTRILRLVNTNEFKRFQTPPVLRVSTKAFGMGRRLPIVARYLS